ncbi:MAG: hypothetical protein GPJ54_16880 [Candidatus Heimdallarchaeota archaeon]|nr:hypothetical protein [Candidatus Heimdallarchaeota archaeon]
MRSDNTIQHFLPLRSHNSADLHNFLEFLHHELLENHFNRPNEKSKLSQELLQFARKVSDQNQLTVVENTINSSIDQLITKLIDLYQLSFEVHVTEEQIAKDLYYSGSYTVKIPWVNIDQVYRKFIEDKGKKEYDDDIDMILENYLQLQSSSYGASAGFEYKWLNLTYLDEYCLKFEKKVFKIIEHINSNDLTVYLIRRY